MPDDVSGTYMVDVFMTFKVRHTQRNEYASFAKQAMLLSDKANMLCRKATWLDSSTLCIATKHSRVLTQNIFTA